MNIAIMSDSHDHWTHLIAAIELANEAGCELLLFAGDLIAPPGIEVLEQFAGQVKFVWGNNEHERVGMTRKMDASGKIELCGDIYEDTVDGVRIFMNHYPRFSELAAKSGEFDLAIFGHTHDYSVEKIADCWLINPGEIQGYKTGQPGFVLFDTKTKTAAHKLLTTT
jgi:uncharacterized protein